MRVAFGLVSLLVVLAIILLVFSMYEAPVLKRGKTAQDDARQLAGRDEDNLPVTHAVTLDAKDRNGQMQSVVVTSVVAGSTIEKHYGLQVGDEIVQLGQLPVKGYMNSSDEAKDFLLSAYQRNEPVVVMRGFEQLVLPLDPKTAAMVMPPAAPKPGATPATPDAPQASAQETPAQPAPEKKKPGGLEGQLDLIRNLPGQPQQQ
jgi:hypothetical protein